MLIEDRTPVADRPLMPDGYGVPEHTEGLVPWDHIVQRLTEAQNYWVATADAHGRPHSTPIWGAYLHGLIFLDGSTETRRGRNISHNPQVAVHLESASDVVIVEGIAEAIIVNAELAEELAQKTAGKYSALGYSPKAADYAGATVQAVRPHTVFAWTDFPKTVTRFRFEKA